MLGDWNYPEIDWAALKSNISENHPATGFLLACSNASLVQKINVPTRVKGVGAGNILDLVLTNNNNIVRKVTVDSPIGKSDHATILVNSVVSMTEIENLPSYFLYGKGNYQALRNNLANVNWEAEFKICKNVNDMWQIFSKHILDGRNAYVPKMHKTATFKERPPWLKKDMLHAFILKRKHVHTENGAKADLIRITFFIVKREIM